MSGRPGQGGGYFDRAGPSGGFQQFLAGGRLSSWLRLLREYGPPDRGYRMRALYVSAATLFSTPFRLYEAVRYARAIRRTEIVAPPVFILGHWRSGTTHVLRVLGQNPELAPVTFTHTMIPELFLGPRVFRYLLSRSLPPVRPMDDVTVAPHEPEEDEYALGNLGPWSFYHGLTFPRHMRSIFGRRVLFEGADSHEVERWKSAYLRFLRKVAFASGNRRLLIKNPAHSGRIRLLLQLFPDARFIHVYRNPYVVYSSTMHWLDREMAWSALQDVSEATVREEAMTNYERLMRRYLTDRHLIPDGHLVEVRFEDFEREPLQQAVRIQKELGIEPSPEARTRMAHYVRAHADYRKNRYRLDAEQRDLVSSRWGFAIREWGYEPPSTQQAAEAASPLSLRGNGDASMPAKRSVGGGARTPGTS